MLSTPLKVIKDLGAGPEYDGVLCQARWGFAKVRPLISTQRLLTATTGSNPEAQMYDLRQYGN